MFLKNLTFLAILFFYMIFTAEKIDVISVLFSHARFELIIFKTADARGDTLKE